jgi:hypothetical protein
MVAETVDHQAGEKIALAMDQSIVGLIEEALAQVEGVVQAALKQLPVKRGPVTTDQAAADERVRVDIGRPEQCPTVCLHQHLLAGLETGKGRKLDVHLVAVDPQMPCPQAFFFMAPEAQSLQLHAISVVIAALTLVADAVRIPLFPQVGELGPGRADDLFKRPAFMVCYRECDYLARTVPSSRLQRLARSGRHGAIFLLFLLLPT